MKEIEDKLKEIFLNWSSCNEHDGEHCNGQYTIREIDENEFYELANEILGLKQK